jgi:hypothetical protein
MENSSPSKFPMVGKNSFIPDGTIIEPGGIIGTDLSENDFSISTISEDMLVEKRKQIHEI